MIYNGGTISDIAMLCLGVPVHFANVLLFRGVALQNAEYLLLSTAGFKTANRSLYVHPRNSQKKLWIVNTHLTGGAESRYDSETQQIQQIEEILKWMEEAIRSQPADAMVLCGDFNAVPDSKAYRLMISKGFRSSACEFIGKDQY